MPQLGLIWAFWVFQHCPNLCPPWSSIASLQFQGQEINLTWKITKNLEAQNSVVSPTHLFNYWTLNRGNELKKSSKVIWHGSKLRHPMTLPFTRKNLRAAKWRSSKLAQSSWFPCLWSWPAHWEGICQDSRKGNFFIPEKIPKLNDHDIFSQIGKEKTIWFNCRQEPVAYVNGVSVTPRYYCNSLQLDENKCWLTVIFEHIWSYLTRSKKNPHANIESSDCLEVSPGLWEWVTMRALVTEIKRWDLELIWATIWSQLAICPSPAAAAQKQPLWKWKHLWHMITSTSIWILVRDCLTMTRSWYFFFSSKR